MNKWVLILGGLSLTLTPILLGVQLSASEVTGLSLVIVGLAMVNQ